MAPGIKCVSRSVVWRRLPNRHNIEDGIPTHEERIAFVFVVSNMEVISGGTMAASIDEFIIQGILVSLPH
jgi:hypothetical protein